MKNSILQEKLKTAREYGSEHVVLHEGLVCLNRCYGITGLLSQPAPESSMICAGEKMTFMTIEELISTLEKDRKSRGDKEIYGILQPQPFLLEEAKDIITVCTITYEENDKGKMLTLLSLTDLSKEENEE